MLAGVGGARDGDLLGASGQPGHDLGDPGGVAWGHSLGCRTIWATAAVKLGGRPFGELRPALALRDDVRENGGALDGVRALPAKGKNFSFRGCIRRPRDILLGQRRVPPYVRAAASREGCQSAADDIGKGKEISLLATFNV
jgi:hypothetical protein